MQISDVLRSFPFCFIFRPNIEYRISTSFPLPQRLNCHCRAHALLHCYWHMIKTHQGPHHLQYLHLCTSTLLQFLSLSCSNSQPPTRNHIWVAEELKYPSPPSLTYVPYWVHMGVMLHLSDVSLNVKSVLLLEFVRLFIPSMIVDQPGLTECLCCMRMLHHTSVSSFLARTFHYLLPHVLSTI